jgi:hypothetical protein
MCLSRLNRCDDSLSGSSRDLPLGLRGENQQDGWFLTRLASACGEEGKTLIADVSKANPCVLHQMHHSRGSLFLRSAGGPLSADEVTRPCRAAGLSAFALHAI